ncbi:MAG: hypothetical protein ACLRP3_09965 [Escherichia sp.]
MAFGGSIVPYCRIPGTPAAAAAIDGYELAKKRAGVALGTATFLIFRRAPT